MGATVDHATLIFGFMFGVLGIGLAAAIVAIIILITGRRRLGPDSWRWRPPPPDEPFWPEGPDGELVPAPVQASFRLTA